jgi:hypothetical protein
MERLTRQQKEDRGTRRPDREIKRSLDEVQAEIADTLDGLGMMRANVKMAVEAIKRRGMYIPIRTTNNRGECVETDKLNPAFRVQREALSALKTFRRALLLLREEETAMLAADAPKESEFEGL